MRITSKMEQRKAVSKERLIEKFLGKRALYETWMQQNQGHNDYTRKLKKRVDHHHNDLAYRGYL